MPSINNNKDSNRHTLVGSTSEQIIVSYTSYLYLFSLYFYNIYKVILASLTTMQHYANEMVISGISIIYTILIPLDSNLEI